MATRCFHNDRILVPLALIGVLLLSGCAGVSSAASERAPALVPPAAEALPAAAAPPAQSTTVTGPVRSITVVGQGEVKTKPNIAYANLGVEVSAPTAAQALAEGQTRMAAILKAIKGLGIAEKDIQTSNFSVSYERQEPEMPPPSTGAKPATPAGSFRVGNMVQVTMRDVTKVGALLDTAVAAGANSVWGVNFGLEDTSAFEAQAREKAVADAKARATSLAKLNGVTLGDVLAISEVVGSQPQPLFGDTAAAKTLSGTGTPIEPGEINFETQIQTVYAIK